MPKQHPMLEVSTSKKTKTGVKLLESFATSVATRLTRNL